MTCQCVSPDCPSDLHEMDMTCPREARRRLQSRDWGDAEVWMCRLCAIDAVESGIFEVMHG